MKNYQNVIDRLAASFADEVERGDWRRANEMAGAVFITADREARTKANRAMRAHLQRVPEGDDSE
jgi:hypothetical protein